MAARWAEVWLESTEEVKGPFDCGGQPDEVERTQKEHGGLEMYRLNSIAVGEESA